eukprot:3005103-Amphidinium_carterae.1
MTLEPGCGSYTKHFCLEPVGIAFDTEVCDTEAGQHTKVCICAFSGLYVASAGFALPCLRWLNQHCWKVNCATVLCKVD